MEESEELGAAVTTTVGVVGLGNMGGALAANLVGGGHDVLANDVAGPERSPAGATFVPDVAEVARRADVVVLTSSPAATRPGSPSP